MEFTKEDIEEFEAKGIAQDQIVKQLNRFQLGFPALELNRPCTPGDGIWVLDQKEMDRIVGIFDRLISGKSVIKFVPASGAATRMFKAFFQFVESEGKERPIEVEKFFDQIERFAFYDELQQQLKQKGIDIQNEVEVVKTMLHSDGLNYGNLPKGMVKFHDYGEEKRTAAQEHIREGIALLGHSNSLSYHFTVSEQHLGPMSDSLNDGKAKSHLDITFSFQDMATDTIAVDTSNHPFRGVDNALLFRPAGHGALIKNLNELRADLIFIKNIDNIPHQHLEEKNIFFKKLLGGIVLELQSKLFDYYDMLKGSDLSEEVLEEIFVFASERLNIDITAVRDLGFDQQRVFLMSKLNRPLRVCGMVKNEGEPGGGPFWVHGNDGTVSPQIVEMAQIDINDQRSKEIVERATHFNPVDIVVSTKNAEGDHFDLEEFVDYETGFISEKSYQGQTIKALELPGLWNGAMADWITVFVDIPVSIFNPVKVVTDLLKKGHQN